MSILTIASSAKATNPLAVNFAAISFFRSLNNHKTRIDYINGESFFVDQSADELSGIFPNAVRLDQCGLEEVGSDPVTVYVNPSALISVVSFTGELEGCTVRVLGYISDGIRVHQPFHSVIAKF